MSVYVVLFNARTENEGIHSLQMEGRQLVLMFEVEDDATRFAVMLEAQDFPSASVEEFDREEIEEFCESAGYEAVLVEDGTLLMPWTGWFPIRQTSGSSRQSESVCDCPPKKSWIKRPGTPTQTRTIWPGRDSKKPRKKTSLTRQGKAVCKMRLPMKWIGFAPSWRSCCSVCLDLAGGWLTIG